MPCTARWYFLPSQAPAPPLSNPPHSPKTEFSLPRQGHHCCLLYVPSSSLYPTQQPKRPQDTQASQGPAVRAELGTAHILPSLKVCPYRGSPCSQRHVGDQGDVWLDRSDSAEGSSKAVGNPGRAAYHGSSSELGRFLESPMVLFWFCFRPWVLEP